VKSAPAPLVALLNGSNIFRVVDLYDIELANGDHIRVSGQSFPVTYPATGTEIPGAPVTFYPITGVERGDVEWSADLDVQTLEVTLLVNKDVTYRGKILSLFVLDGGFDGATITVYYGYFDQNGALVDVLLHFTGTVGDAEPTAAGIKLPVKSLLDKLNVQLPKNLVMPNCSHGWLDDGCDPDGTIRAANTVTGALIGTPTKFIVTVPGTYASDNFKLGVITMTSGTCEGQARAVRTDANGGGGHELSLAVPMPEAPLVGDTFTLITGCDRTQATCTTRYSNLKNFRGFPFVPRPEDTR